MYIDTLHDEITQGSITRDKISLYGRITQGGNYSCENYAQKDLHISICLKFTSLSACYSK